MKKRIIVLSVIGLGTICFGIGTFVFVQGQKKTFDPSTVVSKVENLSILSRRLENLDEVSRTAVFELKNEADKPIAGIAFEAGNAIDSQGYSLTGHTDDQPYLALAGEVFQVKVPLSDFFYEFPLRISAVVYADGTTAGEVDAAKELKKLSHEVRNKKTGGNK